MSKVEVTCPVLTTLEKVVLCKVNKISRCANCPVRTGGSQPEEFKVKE